MKMELADVVALGVMVALAVSLMMTASLVRWASHLGLIDLPSERKVHSNPTPRGGGIAIVLAVLAGLLVFQIWPEVYWVKLGLYIGPFPSPLVELLDPTWWCSMAIAVLGLADDRRPLAWQWRLVGQFAIAGVAVAPDMVTFPIWVSALAVLWLVAMTNAYNMLDNMDLLSGGVAFIAAAGFFFALPSSADTSQLLLGAALVGFLWYNQPPARIFMGDVGSMFLGFTVGFTALRIATTSSEPPWSPLLALCICAVPLYDLTSVVLLRLSQGRSPFHADKQHLSHRFVARGLSSRAAVGLIHLLALVSGAAGLLLYAMPNWSSAAAVFAGFAAGWLGLAYYEFVARPLPPIANVAGSPRGD